MSTPITFESGTKYTVNLLNETIDELATIQPKLVPITSDGYLIENVQYASVLPSNDPPPPPPPSPKERVKFDPSTGYYLYE